MAERVRHSRVGYAQFRPRITLYNSAQVVNICSFILVMTDVVEGIREVQDIRPGDHRTHTGGHGTHYTM